MAQPIMTIERAAALLDQLGDGGREARVKAALRAYRQAPSPETAAAAESALATLPQDQQRALRQVRA